MKKFTPFLFLLLSVSILNAQKLVVNEVDEFTDIVKKTTSTEVVAQSKIKNTLSMYMVKADKTYAVFLSPSINQGCSGSTGNNVIFLMADGSKINLDKDIAKIDCGDNVTSIYMLTDKEVAKLEMIKVKKIRLYMSESYDDFVVDMESRDIIVNMAMIVQ